LFESILEKYKALLDKFGSLSIAEVVRCVCELHRERCNAFEKFSHESKQRAKIESNSCIFNYVKQADKNEDFFEQINRLHGQIQLKHNQIFEDEVEYWKSEFAKVEREIAIKLKMRFNEKAIFMGSVKQDDQNREIRWIVIEVDLEKKLATLLSDNAVGLSMFHKSGCTDIEPEDEWGCAESACSWSASDIRNYLNGSFYKEVFSDNEKNVIVNTYRHVNKGDYLIPSDCVTDCVKLLTLDEFYSLDNSEKKCSSIKDNKTWWLCEQKARGWADTDEPPQIYAVDCMSGELLSHSPDTLSNLRISITVKLDDIMAFVNADDI